MGTKKIVILGGGESGVGAALLGKKKGYSVFVSDSGAITEPFWKLLATRGIPYESGTHSEEHILRADIVVKSPGIPGNAPLIEQIHRAGIPVISEIEFASTFTKALLIGITGSNGKTTTAMLTHHILKQDLYVGLSGNIGNSFSRQVLEYDYPNYVLEVSSFQLDHIVTFKPHIAVITNITPDHLDRYNYCFQSYVASKFRIAENQTEQDYLVYDADDETISKGLKDRPIRSTLLPYSLTKVVENGAYLDNETIKITLHNKTTTMPTTLLRLSGNHNIKNAMAALIAARLLNVKRQSLRDSLECFQGLAHRLEYVLKIDRVRYINDSKGTNVNAVYYALESMDAPTIWIVGGEDKGNDYTPLFRVVNEKVKAIICLGVDNTNIINAFSNIVEHIEETQCIDTAVRIAHKLAEVGDNVLLSPACASFDLFEGYKDRGQRFKEAVKKLQKTTYIS